MRGSELYNSLRFGALDPLIDAILVELKHPDSAMIKAGIRYPDLDITDVEMSFTAMIEAIK